MATIDKTIGLFCAMALSTSYTFLFTFNATEPPSALQPVNAWKVSTFLNGTAETQTISLHYVSTLGASAPEVDEGRIVHPGVAHGINTQQTMALVESSGNLKWTDPQSDISLPTDTATATNNDTIFHDIAVGFMDGPAMNIAFIEREVAVGSAVDIQIHPHLNVYDTSQFQKNDLITVEVQSPILFTWEFESATVEDGDCYQLTEDPNTHILTIKQFTGDCPASLAHLPDTSQTHWNLYSHIQCYLAFIARLGSTGPWAC